MLPFLPTAHPALIHRNEKHCIYYIINRKEAYRMKVVVMRSPRLLAGLLRMVFHIRKEERCEEA
jgi:hypothetical protein